jgi:hypothetical protein
MGGLAILLLAPWLVILAWAYWRFPRSLPRPRGRRRFDTAIVLLSVIAAIALAHVGYLSTVNLPHQGTIGVWQMVAPVLYAYGGFSLVLFLGLWLRRMRWGRSSA